LFHFYSIGKPTDAIALENTPANQTKIQRKIHRFIRLRELKIAHSLKNIRYCTHHEIVSAKYI
jgi:hypothetical protein